MYLYFLRVFELHRYIDAYEHTKIHAYLHPCKHLSTHTHKRTYIYTGRPRLGKGLRVNKKHYLNRSVAAVTDSSVKDNPSDSLHHRHRASSPGTSLDLHVAVGNCWLDIMPTLASSPT